MTTVINNKQDSSVDRVFTIISNDQDLNGCCFINGFFFGGGNLLLTSKIWRASLFNNKYEQLVKYIWTKIDSILFTQQCPIEWFHFACVGLTTKPKGKWWVRCSHFSVRLRLYLKLSSTATATAVAKCVA